MAKFDVFLSHNSIDKPWVAHLKDSLLQYGLSVWLDKDEIRPGDLYAKALEDGLEKSSAVALIVSPESMASGWVEAEYYRALFLSQNKSVKLQLIPVILRDAPLPGFLQDRIHVSFKDDSSYAENVRKLVWGITGVKPEEVLNLAAQESEPEEVPPHAPLFNVPSLPPSYLERNEHIDKIKRFLLQDTVRNVGITGISKAVGLQGMGGIGKTILAAGIAYDEQIRAAFPDGIVWVTIGQKPDIVSAQKIILENFDSIVTNPETPQQGQGLLNKFLTDKKILLILDDVWSVNDLQYFDISSARSKVLITTRHTQVLKGIGAEECRIDVLPYQQAMQLLRVQARWDEDVMPREAAQIVKECGSLPLAISMIGAMLKGKPHKRWTQVLKHLQNAELKSIRQKFSNYPYADLFVAMHVSVEAQPPLIQQLYLGLAIFPQDIPIPETVLDIYWNKDDLQQYDASDVIEELLDASLIFRFDENQLMLHDLQHDYIFSQCPNIPQAHEKLLNAYEAKFPNGWHTIPYEPPYYFHRFFAYHFSKVGTENRAGEVAADLLDNVPHLIWPRVLSYIKLANRDLHQTALKLIKTNRAADTLFQCLKILGPEAKEDAHRLLQQKDQNSWVLIGALNLLKGEAKEDARRILMQGNQHPNVMTVCLNLLKAEAKEDARRLLMQENQHPDVMAVCLKLLGAEAKEEARRLLKQEHQSKEIISVCLKLLGAEAKEEARRLLKQENQTQEVITACLILLGKEGKEHARRLLKQENQIPEILTVCLNMLGAEAKEDARRLLKQEHQSNEVLSVCLTLLGSEAKEDARRLLKDNNQTHQVVTVCLRLLGAEAKEDARRLLREGNRNPTIVASCLTLLGTEAKEHAKYLLEQANQNPRIIITCLTLLGTEAKEDAKRLLQQYSQNPDVVTVCLKMLGAEAREDARRLLDQGNLNPTITVACLNLLGTEAKEDARRFLQQENQNSDVSIVSLDILGVEASEYVKAKLRSSEWELLGADLQTKILYTPLRDSVREQRALDILSKWYLYSRRLVRAALCVFEHDSQKVTGFCSDIIRHWERDYDYYVQRAMLEKYSGHITKSMRHPELLNMAKLAAMEMVSKENETPGLLDEELYEFAQYVMNGVEFDWVDELNR